MTSTADISSAVRPRARKSNGARPSSAPDFLAGGGEMGALMRSTDWSATPLGLPEEWPQSLTTTVSLMLNSRFPMFVWWGRNLTNLYNDAYRPFLGSKHPDALGQSARDVWAEIWDLIGPRAEAVLNRGESTFDEALLLVMERYGYPEETYFTFSYSPIRDNAGTVGGIFCAVTDTTPNIIGERRLKLLRDVAAIAPEVHTPEQICAATATCIAGNSRDLPFALLYLSEGEGTCMRLVASAGIEPNDAAAPPLVDLQEADATWPFASVQITGMPLVLDDLATRFEQLPKGAWNRPPARAVIAPLSEQGHSSVAGFLVAGLNPYLPYEEGYSGFIGLLAGQIAAGIANARAYEEERKRAEALAEIDRAKTQFFSNVSHEFRTPLTLMLGPLEDALADDNLPAADRERLDVAQRNSLRLLKLVNSLLDFSRIEAGRAQATYEPVDLAAFTADIASNFRSACERAGLNLVVDCSPLPEPAYIDKEMWEKIVLNLLSNAFKFTFDGEIELSLRMTPAAANSDSSCPRLSRASTSERPSGKEGVDGRDKPGHDVNGSAPIPTPGVVTLTVRDTGVGIPEHELPRLFERFHRIEGQKSRTYEGSGIGLALVQELVKLHGGAIEAQSKIGHGTSFTVSLPFGTAHLPQDRIDAERSLASTSVRADAYVQEALRWLPDEGAPPDAMAQTATLGDGVHKVKHPGARVLFADDNADMRAYMRRLLGPNYELETVADGQAALDAIHKRRPDLVLADIMMPQLDGFGLLNAIRSAPQLQDIPVLLLSARAGEEAKVEGLGAGADDYLVKPFSARELLSRVDANLEMARARNKAAEALRENDARQAYVIKLGDKLRPLGDPIAIQEQAAQLLGRQLAASRAMYFEFRVEDGREYVVVDRDYHDADTSSIVGRVAAERLGADARDIRAGRTVTAFDKETELATDRERAVWRALGVRAYIGVPLIKDGRLVAGFGVHQTTPRVWTAEEIALVEETAERTWAVVERARAEDELREHAARLEAVLNTVPSAVWFTHDLESHRIVGNAYGARLLRLSSDANVSLSVPPDERPRYRVFCKGEELPADRLPVQRAARGEEIRGQELEVRFDDGSSISILSHATPIRDARGVIRGAVSGAVDITERKRAEESLKKSEADLRLRNAELARFNRAMVDRELRMIELKKEINELSRRQGEPARYPLDFEQDGRQTHV